ncbi:hypothetical protein SAMN06298211_10638 [Prevotellaceae bacterium MN60]|nr:hypothetical protein SAMN06298211_10638 [Prevotellaceae bacterium MN60]
MRKKFKTLAYLPAIALFGIGIIRCVGGGASAGNCVVDDAISAAESQITIIESPVFGKLPSLFEQKLKAGTILSKQFGKIKTESMDEATRNQQHREDAEQTLDDYYQKKIEEAIEGLDGKNIKVEFDEKQVASAKCTLKLTDPERAYFNLVFDVKLKQPIDKEVEFKWEYRDATGTRLQVGSDYIIPGAKFVKEYMATADRDYSMTFDHLYIKF